MLSGSAGLRLAACAQGVRSQGFAVGLTSRHEIFRAKPRILSTG
jgi:hypothetical protein